MSDEKPDEQPDERIEIVSPWAYLNRVTPLELDFGDDGLQTGEAEQFGGLTVEPVEVPLGLKPKPSVLGVPAPLERMLAAGTFGRKWEKVRGAIPHVPYVAPVPAPPRVQCRDAFEGEMPAECWDLLLALTPQQASMQQLRATYAQAGEDRLLKQTGECLACGTVTTVNADGSLKAHPRPSRGKCPGRGTAPDAVDKVKGHCPFCDGMKRLTKKGLLPSHDMPAVKCERDTTGEESVQAFRMLPPTTLPPIESMVLRCVWSSEEYAFGCWTFDNLADDGAGVWSFDYGVIRGAETNNAPKNVGVTLWRDFMSARVALSAAA